MPTDDTSTTAPAAPSTKRPEDITQSPEFIWVVCALATLLFLGAIALWIAQRWRKRQETKDSPVMSLTNFREMFESGEITQDEYERIRQKMAGKLKASLGVPPGVSPPPPAPPKSE